jgi:phosphonate transport system substrate-binding protein
MKFISFISLLLIIFSCNKKSESIYSPQFSDTPIKNGKKEIIFAPHPLHNPIRLQLMFGPIIDILNREIPEAHFTLEASKDYADYNEKIKTKNIAIILPNPYQTIMAKDFNYSVFAKMSDNENFKGIFLVRKESQISKISDLKNKKVSFPAPTALAAAMMPKVFLKQNGIDFRNDFTSKYVGTQESAMLAVYHKETDVGVTWPMAYNSFLADKPELAKELKLILQTKSLINNSLMAKNDLDPKLVKKIKEVFVNLHQSKEGMSILDKMKLSKFEAANDNDYKVVQNFIVEYKKHFGELPK